MMSNRRKVTSPRGTGESPGSGRLQVIRSGTGEDDAPAVRPKLPAFPEIAAQDIHVLIVSLHGATPPPWRRLEVPSAITLDRLHKVLLETFRWYDFDPHSFVTIYGEYGVPGGRRAGRAGRTPLSRDESGVKLVQAAGEEGLGIVYLYGHDAEWRIDILVEKILPAAPGMAYPRCTGGQGDDLPDSGCDGIWEFNDERGSGPLDIYFDPDDLTEDLAEMATVIVTG